jgi:hypothetical protein
MSDACCRQFPRPHAGPSLPCGDSFRLSFPSPQKPPMDGGTGQQKRVGPSRTPLGHPLPGSHDKTGTSSEQGRSKPLTRKQFRGRATGSLSPAASQRSPTPNGPPPPAASRAQQARNRSRTGREQASQPRSTRPSAARRRSPAISGSPAWRTGLQQVCGQAHSQQQPRSEASQSLSLSVPQAGLRIYDSNPAKADCRQPPSGGFVPCRPGVQPGAALSSFLPSTQPCLAPAAANKIGNKPGTGPEQALRARTTAGLLRRSEHPTPNTEHRRIGIRCAATLASGHRNRKHSAEIRHFPSLIHLFLVAWL